MKINLNNKGFSLIELLVAFSIITTTILGIFSLIVMNIQVQVVNKEYLVAAMLAQEGLEIVRNSRDENWVKTLATWDGITDNSPFIIDYDGEGGAYNVPGTYTDKDDSRLYLDVSGFYNHTGVVPTIFYRRIEVEDNTEYIKLSSIVEWEIKGKPYKYVADTLLYDWR